MSCVLQTNPQWEKLPHLALVKVFHCLPMESRTAAVQVCKHWHELQQHAPLWRNLTIELQITSERYRVTEIVKRAVQKAKRFAATASHVHIQLIQPDTYWVSSSEHMVKAVKDILKVLKECQMTTFEIEGMGLYFLKPLLFKEIDNSLIKFLEQQRNLEVCSIKDGQFSRERIAKFLDALLKSSGEKIKEISLERSLDCYNHHLNPTAICELDSILSKFTKLQKLVIDYACLSGRLDNLRKNLGENFKYFKICYNGMEDEDIITDQQWISLSQSCPNLVVSLDVYEELYREDTLSPYIPLISLTTLYQGSKDQSDMLSIEKLALQYENTMEEMNLGHYLERDLTDIFIQHIEKFQRLRTFSLTIPIKTRKNKRFLKAFCDMLKRNSVLKNVTFTFVGRRGVGRQLLEEMDRLLVDMREWVERGLLIKFNLDAER